LLSSAILLLLQAKYRPLQPGGAARRHSGEWGSPEASPIVALDNGQAFTVRIIEGA
jgi:hypothetical protein